MNASMIARHVSMASRRLLPWISLAAGLAVAFSLFGPVRNVSAQGKSLNDGVYTDAQAKRGEQIFMGVGRCYSCHQRDLQGNEQRKSKQLAGADFVSDFQGQTLDDLWYKIRYTMPADIRGAGTLPENQVSDLIAFILSKNGYPTGSQEIGTDRSQLKMVKFDAPKGVAGGMKPSGSKGGSEGGMAPTY